MRGWCIDPAQKTIAAVDVSNDKDIATLVGYDSIISDAVDDSNSMFFDEDCFLRQSAGRFQIDKLIPVSGKAVITGTDADGNITDVSLSEEELAKRLAYLE